MQDGVANDGSVRITDLMSKLHGTSDSLHGCTQGQMGPFAPALTNRLEGHGKLCSDIKSQAVITGVIAALQDPGVGDNHGRNPSPLLRARTSL